MFEVGDRVERNPANWWPNTDSDGGAGNQGTVKEDDGEYVHVAWDLTAKTWGYFPERLAPTGGGTNSWSRQGGWPGGRHSQHFQHS